MSKIEVDDRIVFEHGPYNLVRKQMNRTYLNIDRRIDIKNYSFFFIWKKVLGFKNKIFVSGKKIRNNIFLWNNAELYFWWAIFLLALTKIPYKQPQIQIWALLRKKALAWANIETIYLAHKPGVDPSGLNYAREQQKQKRCRITSDGRRSSIRDVYKGAFDFTAKSQSSRN